MSKTVVISACAAILVGSAAVAWGTIPRGKVAKAEHGTSFAPSELQLKIDTLLLPQQKAGDLSFVFTD